MNKVTRIESHYHKIDGSTTYFIGSTFEQFWKAADAGAKYHRLDEPGKTYLALKSVILTDEEFKIVVESVKDDNNGTWEVIDRKDVPSKANELPN